MWRKALRSTRRSSVTGLTPAEELAFAQLIKPRSHGEVAEREHRYQTQRDLVVAVLTRLAAKHAHITRMSGTKLAWTEGICIHSPVGQLAWGLAPDREPLFHGLPRWTCAWDRHNASERDARLRKLTALPVADLLAWLNGRSLATRPRTRK